MAGRPPEPVPADKAEKIIDALYEGRSLTDICAEIGIGTQVVSKWKAKDEEFRRAYACAREEGAAVRVERSIPAVDKATTENWQVVKMQAEHALKIAACFCPRVFGTKVQVGGDGGQPIVVQSKAEREAELAAILVQAAARADDAAGGGEGAD